MNRELYCSVPVFAFITSAPWITMGGQANAQHATREQRNHTRMDGVSFLLINGQLFIPSRDYPETPQGSCFRFRAHVPCEGRRPQPTAQTPASICTYVYPPQPHTQTS